MDNDNIVRYICNKWRACELKDTKESTQEIEHRLREYKEAIEDLTLNSTAIEKANEKITQIVLAKRAEKGVLPEAKVK